MLLLNRKMLVAVNPLFLVCQIEIYLRSAVVLSVHSRVSFYYGVTFSNIWLYFESS